MSAPSFKQQRGVSLIEALVAFGVMAFGMLAVVGMQATLRGNGDLARQRAEAVRIAQDYIEDWRGFSTLVATADRTAYADIATSAALTFGGTNANYTIRRQVNNDTAVDDEGTSYPETITPQRRTLVVDVEWTDRRGEAQQVRLSTVIAGIEPELAASMVLASKLDPLMSPRGRYRGIPPSAVQPFGMPGLSGFVPPGQTGGDQRVAWIFNNITGALMVCRTNGLTSASLLDEANVPDCTGAAKALLISGAVRFATSNAQQSASTVVNPAGPDFPSFGLTAVASAGSADGTCFQDPLADTVTQYYCAVPITLSLPNWTGSLVFGSPLVVGNGPSALEYKVCRYMAGASYTAMTTAMLSQNFVIIRAGNGSSTSYSCPTTGTPRTWSHQP